jgi:hypothetical protein
VNQSDGSILPRPSRRSRAYARKGGTLCFRLTLDYSLI